MTLNPMSGAELEAARARAAHARAVKADKVAAKHAEAEASYLELSGFRTPDPPYRKRGKVIACRVPTNLAVWVEEQAERDHCTVNAWMIRLLRQRRAEGPQWPADVNQWLLAQAAACRKPGDWEHALIVTVRDLAVRYPQGCRL